MEDQNSLKIDSTVSKRNFLFAIVCQFVTVLIIVAIISFAFSLGLIIETIVGLVVAVIFYFLFFRMHFPNQITIGSKTIELRENGQLLKLPVKDTFVYRWFGVYFGGFYLKYRGKYHFLPSYELEDKLTKLPGYRSYHLWIPIILIIMAMIGFIIWLQFIK